MQSDVYIGHHCPRCGTTVGAYASIGGIPSCPGCGGPLTASPGGPKTSVMANVTCKKCGAHFGMISVVGGDPKCRNCGGGLP